MSWLQRLSETYDACFGREQFANHPLPPLSSVPQRTQLHVTLWEGGTFQRAEIRELDNTTMFVTEDSAGRSGTKPAANPLTDQLEYCALGVDRFGGDASKFERFRTTLENWIESGLLDKKVKAVYTYVTAGSMLDDLLREQVLLVQDGELQKVKVGKSKLDPLKLWVRWSVYTAERQAETWSDTLLAQCWAEYDANLSSERALCMMSGDLVRTTQKHPKRLRHSGDSAKLISANDNEGFTYLGRFRSSEEALTIGYLNTQKAHNALRWLIERQGTRHGDQVIVSWSVCADATPRLAFNSAQLFTQADEDLELENEADDAGYQGDTGQAFARRLNRLIRGYGAKLKERNDVVTVMALDSSTDGRMATLYYRELKGSEFLERIERWHKALAWPQNFGNGNRFVGAPAPRDIARAAYARKVGEGAKRCFEVDDKLLRATVNRLLPCIVDAAPIPRDVIRAAVAQTIRLGSTRTMKPLENEEFARSLGVTCALIKGSKLEEDFRMSLQEQRTTRAYLFGRLLAIAESIERTALEIAEEKRETAASRYMQAFADRPFETWLIIAKSLKPYEARLRANPKPWCASFLKKRQDLIANVGDLFDPDEFTSKRTRLDSEFLLGYYCQYVALTSKRTRPAAETSNDEDNTNDKFNDQD